MNGRLARRAGEALIAAVVIAGCVIPGGDDSSGVDIVGVVDVTQAGIPLKVTGTPAPKDAGTIEWTLTDPGTADVTPKYQYGKLSELWTTRPGVATLQGTVGSFVKSFAISVVDLTPTGGCATGDTLSLPGAATLADGSSLSIDYWKMSAGQENDPVASITGNVLTPIKAGTAYFEAGVTRAGQALVWTYQVTITQGKAAKGSKTAAAWAFSVTAVAPATPATPGAPE